MISRGCSPSTMSAIGIALNTAPNRVVYDRVLQLYQPAVFAGKVVIIGGSDLKSHDFYPTTYGLMSGMQIHANILATLRKSGKLSLSLSPGVIFALAWCCSLLAMLPLIRWTLWSSCLAVLLEITLVMAGAACWNMRTCTVFPASVPVFAVILTYNGIALYEYSRVRLTLSKFIGPDMVKRALYLFTRLRLGSGTMEEASAMFCDLRGYAALSASLPPETIAVIVNAYTDTVVSIVRRYHGRPVDYAGDGVFVLFEESLAGRQHALQAVQAALEVQRVLTELREPQRMTSLPELDVGIAIHSGRMMIGVLGSEHFLKMGAIGDVVNVAARVQGVSRQCGYRVLVTEVTFQQIRQQIAAEYCGAFSIYGHLHPVEVYGIAETRIADSCPATVH